MIQNKNNTNSRIFNLVAAIPWFPLPPFSSPSVRNPPCILLSLHVRPNSAICTVFSRLVAQNGGRASILRRSKVETLACFRTGFVRRSPTMKPVTRERASIVTGIINGPSLFSLIRASRRPCHASRASFVEKNNTQPPPPPRFRAFPITSSLIDTSLPPYTPGLTLSLPFLPFPPLLHTHVRTYKPPSSTASTRSPLCTPPCHSSISLCLHLSLPFDHQPRPLFLAHSLSFSRRRGTGTRYVILSMARRNMNASSVRFRLPSWGGGIAQPTLNGNCNHGNAYLCESIGVWRTKRRWMEEEEGDTFRYRRGWIRAAGNEQRRTRAKRGNFRTTFIGNYCFRPGVRGEWLIIAWGYYLLSRPSHDYLSWNARLPSIVHNYGDEKVFRG